MLIDELQNVGTFNTADCEQTEADKAVFVEQQKKIAGFNKWVADNAIERLGVIAVQKAAPVEEESLELPQMEIPEEDFGYMSNSDYSKMALGDY